MTEQTEAAQLINQARERWGLSVNEMAEQMGRSPRMIRKIMRGETAGESYVPSLRETVNNGHPEHQPPRARRADGKLRNVRGKKGKKGVAPPERKGRYVDLPKRGKATSTIEALGPGSRRSTFQAPKTKGAKGRKEINQKIAKALRDERGGTYRGRHGQFRSMKRVKFEAVTSTGRKVTVGSKGGYSLSDVRKGVESYGGDALGWMSTQVQDRYVDTQGKVNIVGWQMTTYYGPEGLSKTEGPNR